MRQTNPARLHRNTPLHIRKVNFHLHQASEELKQAGRSADRHHANRIRLIAYELKQISEPLARIASAFDGGRR